MGRIKRSSLTTLLLIVVALIVGTIAAHADGAVPSFGIEANTVSFSSANPLPSDFETGGVASLSLTPHIALHGSLLFGISHTYVRANVGPRITVTDVDNQNLSAGVGLEYHASTEPRIRPEGWNATASIGLKPWPA